MGTYLLGWFWFDCLLLLGVHRLMSRHPSGQGPPNSLLLSVRRRTFINFLTLRLHLTRSNLVDRGDAKNKSTLKYKEYCVLIQMGYLMMCDGVYAYIIINGPHDPHLGHQHRLRVQRCQHELVQVQTAESPWKAKTTMDSGVFHVWWIIIEFMLHLYKLTIKWKPSAAW